MKTSQKIYLPFKRLISIVGSLVGIILCFVLLWWWVIIINAISTGGHPFFVHKRIGRYDKPFNLIKFRSMRLDVSENMSSENANIDDSATKFGKFLRATSIDETPQLLNIFIGDMAFIGPRPLCENEFDHVTIELRKQNGADKIRPGLSGYAQIHGRTEVSPYDKGVMDGVYYQKFSFFFDTKIFIYTVLKIFGAVKGR